MRDKFPGHFRPSSEEFQAIWRECIFAVDANVLLNLYRYSAETRKALEDALLSVADRLFLPHQAAREFLKNRLSVTAGQADEYARAITKIKEISENLANTKKHPFLVEQELIDFSSLVPKLLEQLEKQRQAISSRLSNDEILEFVSTTFDSRTGAGFDEDRLKDIEEEGDARYQSETPPGYKDGKKDASGDRYRKYGDLIIWKQLIDKSKECAQPVIFITDDKKDDWWQEQSGRTIGPRPELREEFISDTSKNFWMYTVDKFVEEAARAANTTVDESTIAEIIEVSEDAKSESIPERDGKTTKILHPVLTEGEILGELQEFLESHPSADQSVGLKYFVVNHLGSQNYEINHSYGRLNSLAEKGLVQIFKRTRADGSTAVHVRLSPSEG